MTHDPSPGYFTPGGALNETPVDAEAETGKMSSPSPTVASLPPVAAGTRLYARFSYEVEYQVGKGGFGTIFVARRLNEPFETRQDIPPERVVIKLLHPSAGQNPDLVLRRELSALLALRHDRIVRLYDWTTDPPHRFVVLEYLKGGSLYDLISVGSQLEEPEAWRALEDLLIALNAAHRSSLLHLDIKPGNVLRDGRCGYVLADFGVSQGSMVSHTVVEPGAGTRDYRAPEQHHGDHDLIGARTDLWGVGATLWSALTGLRLDLPEESPSAAPARPGFGLPPVSRYSQCSRELEEILMSLVAIDPARRPGGAAEMLARVRGRHRARPEGIPVVAAPGRPLSPAERTGVVRSLVDPLWISVFRDQDMDCSILAFEDGELLCAQGEDSFRTFVLLAGEVSAERNGIPIGAESREGAFLGETATLTGMPRIADVRALGTVVVGVFNAAELERFVTRNPAVGIRLVKTLAERLITLHLVKAGE
jgi:serine/threonine protein kinase